MSSQAELLMPHTNDHILRLFFVVKGTFLSTSKTHRLTLHLQSAIVVSVARKLVEYLMAVNRQGLRELYCTILGMFQGQRVGPKLNLLISETAHGCLVAYVADRRSR